MPIDYSKYPPNWKTEIRPAILKRAGDRCERCGASNHAIGYRDETGLFFETPPNPSPGAEQMPRFKLIRIVLTVAHLNHDVEDSSPLNLAALCQKCHLTHDAGQHKATRQKNRFRNIPDLL